MLQSMTGYGSNSLQIDELEIYVEIKTLNSRYFDSKISIPSTLSSQELILLIFSISIGIISCIIPAFNVYKMNISKTLTDE